jgi:transmembrane sensor
MPENGINGEKINNFFKGDYSDKDSLYVDNVFCDDSKEGELKHLLLRQFYELLTEENVEIKNLEHILHRIHFDINTNLSEKKGLKFEKIIKWSFRIAGIIILPFVILIGIRMFKDTALNKETWVEIKAPAWTRAQFSLPDGTTGWLNSNSSVKYNGSFVSNRNIILTGEAFFDVNEDKKRPFRVNTNDVIIEVLGTRFNVASYENENNIEVVLEEGKLVFTNGRMGESYIMSPNDLVTYDKTLKDYSIKEVEAQKYISWTEGKLVFRNDPLDVIARRLERWYNIDIELNVEQDEDIRLRATFVDEGLEEVLYLLKRSLHISYIIENSEIGTNGTYNKRKVIILPETN